jgi:type II secretory ATPase GspE/PulE/Tfp pilus assembly ATPase PilB-like protein
MSAVDIPKASPTPVRRAPLIWPLPHHMRVIDPSSETDSEHERGLLTIDGARKLSGTVLRIDFDAETLEFAPEAGARRVLPFTSLRSLFLTRAMSLERIPLALPAGSVEAVPTCERRKCAIVFKDGDTLEADVVSLEPRKCGLFLFAAVEGRGNQRWFIPTHAIASYRIGEPLGKVLLDRKALPRDALEAGLKTQQRLRTTRIGDYLAVQGTITREQVEAALLRQKTMTHLRLGDALVQEKRITAAQRDAALATQALDRHKRLGEILVEMGAVTAEVIRHVLVEQLGVPAVNLARFQYDAGAINAIPVDLVRKYVVIPLYRTATRIAVAIENPHWWEALQALEKFTGLKVDPAIAAREDILAAIAQAYGAAGRDVEATAEVAVESDVGLANQIIADAYDQGASDIHVESMPSGGPMRVRFRVNGVLRNYLDVGAERGAALVSRLKVMSGIEGRGRRALEGKIRFGDFGPQQRELRVLAMPAVQGPGHIVMRVAAAPRLLSLAHIDLSTHLIGQLKAMAESSSGLLLVCGPAGSGTTTTLNALLAYLNAPSRKIWTIEDPIEISQDGLCQVEADEAHGLSIAQVLRGLRHADADVIMVSNMEDASTARAAIAASLTGSLVLSTLNTGSAAESLGRLLHQDIDPFDLSECVVGVVAQRLLPRLCVDCRVPHAATRDEIEMLAHEYCRETDPHPDEIARRWLTRYASEAGALTLHSPVGCALCGGSGYRGRMAVHELLVPSPAMKALIRARAAAADILEEALHAGMVTLRQDAIEKVVQGDLDLEQVRIAAF